jgi:hypothetical protein
MQPASTVVKDSATIRGKILPLRTEHGFVINLSASTTPMALARPAHPELQRFSFFVSRRREEGRERFRLHMGYFESQEQAEKLLEIVREIYPAAWAGIAPGQRLRESPEMPFEPLPELRPEPLPAIEPMVAEPSAAPMLTLVPDPPAREPAADPETSPSRPAKESLDTQRGAAQALSNVREVIAALDDGAAPLARPLPELRQAVLTDAQALQVLEGGAPGAKAALEPACFAVQLMWSVQEIDMTRVPQLAIFSAYTLYGAEGNRSGRRWYGLRLGFFTDAISAKQVAQYVRSEFSTVSVVPVSGRERERARAAAPRALPTVLPNAASSPTPEFQLIDTPRSAPAVAAEPKPHAALGKRAKLRVAPKKKALSLEETLEILGADELQIDQGRGELLIDPTAGQGESDKPRRSSRLGRLIERLSDRLGGA